MVIHDSLNLVEPKAHTTYTMYVAHRAMHTTKGIVCSQINPLNTVTMNEITFVVRACNGTAFCSGSIVDSAVEKLTFIEGNVSL